jgi:3-methyladenine DNA glycosylase AlkD
VSRPPDVARLADELKQRLDALPDSSTARVRQLRRQYSPVLVSASASDVLGIAEALLDQPISHTRRFVAYELIASHRAARSSVDADLLERLADGMADWGAVDTFSCLLAGPAWRTGLVSDEVIAAWARSPSRWWRRAALVSTTSLNARGTSGDPARTLRIATLLAADRDDMVVKAMSWALRDLSKRDPEAVRGFLAQHQLAPRVVREVTSKLTTGLKTARRLSARADRPSPSGLSLRVAGG